MGALDQYTGLYREFADHVNAGSADPLNALRSAALSVLDRKALPAKGSENYETIDLDAMLATDYGLNIDRIPLDVNPAATFRCDVPVMSPELLMNVNGLPSLSEAAKKAPLPKGVECGSLRDFARKDPAFIAKYYGTAADIENPTTALDTLLAQDGLYLRVHSGVRLEKPLQLVNILSSLVPFMAVRRMLIIIEEDAVAEFVTCDHTQTEDVELMSLCTTEIFVGARASFRFYDLEESTLATSRISTLYLHQEERSEVTIASLTLFNGRTRNEFYCRFRGEHSSLRLYGLGIEDKQREISVYTRVEHNVGHCKTDELFKFTADDESRAAFTGLVYVAPGAVGTEAYQANRNLLGSENAKIHTKPQLEIYNDDVKCSHGAAIGQLDEKQIFYMRSRGLDENMAKLLLRQAFMADVIHAVEIPALRDRLQMLVERRYAGQDSACASCRSCDRAERIEEI